MTDWQRIEEIFGEVVEVAPEERSVHLDRLCGAEAALRREVESLLASHDAAETTFLHRPPSESPALMVPEPPASGERVGPYRLLDVLGEGGMGKVYLAERADGAFDRQVAVKVLRQGMDSDTAVLRFDLERRILAGLDHPGIARLLDGGTTEAEAPFVVMEWVDGEPIDQYCDSQGLSVDERVDLFLEVAEAVASAHRSLVIHRDIKPSNVLVDHQGRAKLLDFGIAKMLDRPWDDVLGSMTQSWHRVLTPNYASPEQVRGEPVTVTTDVYLLGILLYKLLSGRLPHHFESHSLAEVERILTAERPRPPSQARRGDGEKDASLKGLDRIDADLDHIVLKALRTEPAERYESVQQLADDLRRFRAGEPVEARAGNRRYVVKKFAQRHWRSLSLVGLVFSLLTLFAIDRAIQVERRDQALARAEASLQRTEGIWSFVEDLFWQADPEAAKGQQLTVAQAVDRGEEKLVQGGVDAPEVDALIHALFGRIRLGLGEYEEAETSLAQARSGFEALPSKDTSLRVAEWRAWGDYGLARLHQLETVEDEGAEEAIAEAIASTQRAYEASRSLEATDPILALELSNPLAEIYCLLERWDEAAPLTEEAMRLIEGAQGTPSLAVADALGRRALVVKAIEGDLAKARQLYGRALDIYLEAEGPIHPEVANLHNQLGLVAMGLEDAASALESHQEALRVRRLLFPEGHQDVHQSHGHLANLYRARGEFEQAARQLREAVEVSQEVHGPTSSWTVHYVLRLSEALLEGGQPADAERWLEEQLTPQARAARPPGSRMVVQAEGLLGAAWLAQGKEGGDALLRRSLQTLRDRPNGFEGAIQRLESFADTDS